jgi:hypothetical protein
MRLLMSAMWDVWEKLGPRENSQIKLHFGIFSTSFVSLNAHISKNISHTSLEMRPNFNSTSAREIRASTRHPVPEIIALSQIFIVVMVKRGNFAAARTPGFEW